MERHLKAHIEYVLCVKIHKVEPLSGGDISQAYLLETETERFFCKVHLGKFAFDMFRSEKSGLEAISRTKTIAVPKVLLCEAFENGAFLLMEYIEAKNPTDNDMSLFGHQLAALHQLSESVHFGWESPNFIGSLPQSNTKHTDWSKFYAQQRLLPQLKMARDSNLLETSEIPSEETLLTSLRNLFPKTTPSLLHGDLWTGNYLISQTGKPYLIDPACYYGHHEVDMAMTWLFGGFDAAFYNAYSEHFPKTEGEKERNDSYQLYYLLVHLNLFGSSYKTAVNAILKRYF